MEIQIDEQADAAYIRLASGTVYETKTVGEFGVDYSCVGRVLGIEIVGLRQYLAKHGSIKISPQFLAALAERQKPPLK